MFNNLAELAPEFEDVFRAPHELGPFRLLDLPPELWIKVLGFAVTRPGPLDITRSKYIEQQKELVRQPPITRVCRLLRQEALPLFYRNVFEIYHWDRVACARFWLIAIGKENLRSMGQLRFHAKFSPDFWTEKFSEIGIAVKVEIAEDQSTARQMLRFQEMIVSFL